MSAILYNAEPPNQQHQQQQQDMSTNNNYTVDDLTETYVNERNCQDAHVDIDGATLAAQIAELELNGMKQRTTSRQQSNCDGSDSGVDIAITNIQRELVNDSNMSGGGGNGSGSGSGSGTGSGYTISQSCNETTHELNLSCNSSLISCGSDLYEAKSLQNTSKQHATRSTCNNYEYCSDNGSESSYVQNTVTMKSMHGTVAASTANSVTAARRTNNVKKKVAMFEPTLKGTKEKDANKVAASPNQRPRSSSQLQRAVSLPRSTQPSSLRMPRERAHDKQLMPIPAGSGKASNTATPTRQYVTPNSPQPQTSTAAKPQKPDSLPTPLNRKHSMSMQRLVQRTPSLSRARTPGTPSDDGRWPAVTQQQRPTAVRRGMSVTPDMSSLKLRNNVLSTTIEQRATTQSPANPYSTLPRRRKQQSVEDLTSVRGSRSSSISRESRMTSSVVLPGRKNLLNSYANNTTHASTAGGTKNTAAARRTPAQPKTRIYHEISVQTALTNDDIDRALAGSLCVVPAIDVAEKHDQQTQSDIRDREVERLQDEVRQLKQRENSLNAKLQREREEKLTMQRELTLNTERVIGMLEMARIIGGSAGTPSSEDGENHDSLLMLESQIQLSGHELIERHKEIGQLRKLCMSLQVEMERSLTAQKNLIEEKAAIEQESNELQDFLQHEKAAMCDALKELEVEYQNCQQTLASRDEEVKVLRDECRHLVRLNEQRRQENRMLQTKYSALEAKSKELILQQNASAAGASTALSGLHTRLDNLVEQLVFSYNISEHDLEDNGFQSDATMSNGTDGNGAADASVCEGQTTHRTNATPNTLDLMSANASQQKKQQQQITPQFASDGSLSPQRNQSFIAAVISAIRQATTTHAGKRASKSAAGVYAGKRNNHNGHANHQQHNNINNNNNNNYNSHNSSHNNNNSAVHEEQQPSALLSNALNGGDDSDSTEMLDSETEPCLMMDNVLEDVVQPDSHSHNMVSSCMGIISQIDLPNDLNSYAVNGDNSLHNLSQAIANRQQLELEMNALAAQRPTGNVPINLCGENSISEDLTSCHDSLAEMPSLIEYSTTQAVVDQVIEVDTLITKLLKVLRLVQLDNDNCIQQLIVDKNKLQQHKEDMLEKLKDLQDVNIKLQDELMDATQELMLKNNDLSSTKAEMQRHRNEIDRLTEDICTLSTLCSNYKKLSPLTEFPPMLISTLQNGADNGDTTTTSATPNDDIRGIINLLKLWHNEGQLHDQRIKKFLQKLLQQLQADDSPPTDNGFQQPHNNNERLLIYANQLENILITLKANAELEQLYPAIKEMRQNIETVKLNADWLNFIQSTTTTTITQTIEQHDDIANANQH